MLNDSTQYRLVIADDHPLFRGALREAVGGLFAKAAIGEAGTFDEARRTLNDLNASISSSLVPGNQPALKTLVDGQIAKLSSQKV